MKRNKRWFNSAGGPNPTIMHCSRQMVINILIYDHNIRDLEPKKTIDCLAFALLLLPPSTTPEELHHSGSPLTSCSIWCKTQLKFSVREKAVFKNLLMCSLVAMFLLRYDKASFTDSIFFRKSGGLCILKVRVFKSKLVLRITQNFRDQDERCKLFNRMLAFYLLRQYTTRFSIMTRIKI